MGTDRMKCVYCHFACLIVLILFSSVVVSETRAIQESSSLRIVSPSEGFTVSPDQTITVVVEVEEGSSLPPIQVVGEDLGISAAKITPPFEFTLHIPNHLIGPKKIRAVGRIGPENLFFSVPVTLNIETPAAITSLGVSPEKIFFERTGEQTSLSVAGTFDDGKTLTITHSARTTFSSNDPTVATLSSTGRVTAVAPVYPGITEKTTEVIVRYGDKSVAVPVIFRPRENVEIDIKPGSDPNSINLGSGGTVPVAILSTEFFDATTVDPLSVTLASAHVNLKGKGTPMASSQDVNGDGRLDLVVHVETEALQLSATDQQAILKGKTSTGVKIRGSDSIRVVP